MKKTSILIFFTIVLTLKYGISFAFEIKGDLIIVHPSRTWDPLAIAEEGILAAIAASKLKGTNIYMLKHNDQFLFSGYPNNIDSYYIKNRNGIKEIKSEGGENSITPETNEITIVGGYLEFCLANTIAHIMDNKKERIKVNIYLPGVFAHGDPGDDDKLYIPTLPDNFDLFSMWPYPVNPDFILLERQIGRFVRCPDRNFIYNNMFSYGTEYPMLGRGPTPEHFKYTYSCNGENTSEHLIGNGGANLLHINFVTKPLGI